MKPVCPFMRVTLEGKQVGFCLTQMLLLLSLNAAWIYSEHRIEPRLPLHGSTSQWLWYMPVLVPCFLIAKIHFYYKEFYNIQGSSTIESFWTISFFEQIRVFAKYFISEILCTRCRGLYVLPSTSFSPSNAFTIMKLPDYVCVCVCVTFSLSIPVLVET